MVPALGMNTPAADACTTMAVLKLRNAAITILTRIKEDRVLQVQAVPLNVQLVRKTI
jgi:hypothetical protein